MYVLYVHYSGLCLFKIKEFEEIGYLIQAVRSSLNDFKKVSSIFKLKAFYAFRDLNETNDNIASIKANKIPMSMIKFIEKFNFKKNQNLGFEFLNLTEQFKSKFGINIIKHVGIFEIIRCIKVHIDRFLKNHRDNSLEKLFLKSLCHKIIEKNSSVPFSGINVTNNYHLITDLEKNLNIKLSQLRAMIKPFYPELLSIDSDDNLFLPHLLSIYYGKNDCDVFEKIKEVFGEEISIKFKNITLNTIGTSLISSNSEMIKQLSNDILLFNNDIKDCKTITSNVTKTVAPNLSSLLNNYSSKDSNNLNASKLIATAGSLKKLSELPSTTIHTITFKDSLLRKGKFDKMPRKDEDKLNSKQSKMLSDKAALACRVDYFSNNKSINNEGSYGQSLAKDVMTSLQSWSNKNVIQINSDNKQEVVDRIKRMKLKRKSKRKQWLKRKTSKQSEHNIMEIDMES